MNIAYVHLFVTKCDISLNISAEVYKQAQLEPVLSSNSTTR